MQRIQINGESYRVYIDAQSDAQMAEALYGNDHFLWIRQTIRGVEVTVDCIPGPEKQVYDSTSLDGRQPTENQRLQDIEKRLSAVERRTFSPLELLGGRC